MSTNERARRVTGGWRRWVVPGVAVLIGVIYAAAGWRGDDRGFAVGGLAVMLAVAVAVVAFSRSSETIDGLLHRRDERINRIDSDASLFAGMTLIAVVLGAFVVEIAQGEDGQPYSALGAIAGVAYVVALVFLRFRR